MKSMFFSPQNLAAAMRGGNQASAPAPTVQQAAPVVTGAPSELNVISDTPGASAYADRLIAAGMRPNQTGSAWEGVGSIAQLASGYYNKMKDDDRQKERDNALTDYISKHAPELAPLYAAGNSEIRARLANDLIGSQGEKRKEEAKKRQTQELAQSMQGAIGPDGTIDNEKLRAFAIQSGNPKLIETILDNATKKSNERDTSSHRVRVKADALSPGGNYEELKRKDPEAAARIWQQASGLEAGLPPEAIPGASKPGKYFDIYESARSKEEKDAGLRVSVNRDQKNDAEIQANFAAAQRGMQALNVVEGALANAGYTGVGGNAVLLMKKLGAAVGLDVEKTANNELIGAIANELAKGARAGYPGSVSNFEMQTYLRSVVSNENTPEANKKILEFLRMNMGEQIARAEDADKYRQMRIEEGKPAFLAHGFEKFYRDQVAIRKVEFEKKRDEFRKQFGLNDRGEAMSREEKLAAQRDPSTAKAGAPAGEVQEGAVAVNKQTGQRIVRKGGQWVPFDDVPKMPTPLGNFDTMGGFTYPSQQ